MAKKSTGPRILTASDFHVTPRPQDEYRWNIFSTMFENLDKCDYWAILGDIAEAKDCHPASLVNRVIGWISQMASEKPGIVVMGNHDYIDPTDSFWKMLGEINNVTFVDRSNGFCEGQVVAISHTCSQEEFDLRVLGLRTDLILCHQTFNGAKSDGGNHTLTGISPPKTKAQIITGDVHRPQTIGNITYVGAPHPVDFGDSYEPRMLLWTPEKTTSIPLDTIRKLNIKIGPENDLPKLRKGDQVRVTVEMKRADAGRWEEIKQGIMAKIGKSGAILDSIEAVIRVQGAAEKAQDERRGDGRASADPKVVLNRFAASKSVEDGLLKTGQSLLMEVL